MTRMGARSRPVVAAGCRYAALRSAARWWRPTCVSVAALAGLLIAAAVSCGAAEGDQSLVLSTVYGFRATRVSAATARRDLGHGDDEPVGAVQVSGFAGRSATIRSEAFSFDGEGIAAQALLRWRQTHGTVVSSMWARQLRLVPAEAGERPRSCGDTARSLVWSSYARAPATRPP
jgi:hypothetical protein